MNVKKLKRIALLLIISLIIVIFISVITSNEDSKVINNNNNQNQNEISTESTVNLINEYDNDRMIQDYTNPTTEEKAKVFDLYGVENVSFTKQGLVIYPTEYDNTEKRLLTDIWVDNEMTNKVSPPTVGEMYLLEVGQTYLIISLKDVTEKELKQYINEINDEYSDVTKIKSDSILYYAKNDDGSSVKIEYKKSNKKATIEYEF